VLRCPLTYSVNGQQHSSSYFVCSSQHHGLVQGGAPAPATGGACLQGPLPASLPTSCIPPLGSSTKEMRIAPVAGATCK
jgi:hypothetical protein